MRKEDKKYRERAIILLDIGKRKLIKCPTSKGKIAIKKTNKHLREVIRNGLKRKEESSQ